MKNILLISFALILASCSTPQEQAAFQSMMNNMQQQNQRSQDITMQGWQNMPKQTTCNHYPTTNQTICSAY